MPDYVKIVKQKEFEWGKIRWNDHRLCGGGGGGCKYKSIETQSHNIFEPFQSGLAKRNEDNYNN